MKTKRMQKAFHQIHTHQNKESKISKEKKTNKNLN